MYKRQVKEPDIAKCTKRKDFGQGFYLTTSKELAESFLRTSIAKAIATGTIEEGQKFGYISTFEFNLSGNLKTHIFESADVDWLHCIAAHRKKKMFIEVEREMARYDIIAGKIADDATNATLTAYLAGAFGTAGDKMCIRDRHDSGDDLPGRETGRRGCRRVGFDRAGRAEGKRSNRRISSGFRNCI